jgi:hypothetical protein
MAARKLNDISIAELTPFFDGLEAQSESLTPDDLADEMILLWRTRLAPDQLYRLRAEQAIFLSQDFQNGLLDTYRPLTETIIEGWRKALAALGSKTPDADAWEFSLWTRGLYFMLGALGGVAGQEQEAQLRQWVLRLVKSLLSKD